MGCNLNRSIEDIIRSDSDWDLATSHLKVQNEAAVRLFLPRMEGKMVKRA
jgi:hypothetical protein